MTLPQRSLHTRTNPRARRGYHHLCAIDGTAASFGRGDGRPGAHRPRDFVPWRFSDAGSARAPLKHGNTASEKPAQKETFTAFRDGMDSGTALSYSPFSGRNPWSVASPPFSLLTLLATAASWVPMRKER